MIKVNEEYVEIEGEKLVIMAELASVINCLTHENGFTEDEIDRVVKVGKLTIEEMHKETEMMANRMLTMALMGAMLNSMRGEDDD